MRGRVTGCPPSLENLHHSIETMQAAYFLARLGGETVGCGLALVSPGAEAGPVAEGDASVLPELRRRGIGTALLQAVSDHGRSLGKDTLQIEVREDDPESAGFLERRGYAEIERQKEVSLDLTAIEAPEVVPPEGIEIAPWAERPDVLEAMYETGLEASGDIPGLDAALKQSHEQWRSFELERPSRSHELSFVALHGEEVVGFASLDVISGHAFHGLTAVRRAWRGRGVATALKLSQIRAAKLAGFERLLTESAEDNEPMRRLNEKLGYRPSPGMIVFRGPLL